MQSVWLITDVLLLGAGERLAPLGPRRRNDEGAGEVRRMSVLDLFRLGGKIAMVTACRRGIGKAMAEALAEASAEIIGVNRSLEPGSEIEHGVRDPGHHCGG